MFYKLLLVIFVMGPVLGVLQTVTSHIGWDLCWVFYKLLLAIFMMGPVFI